MNVGAVSSAANYVAQARPESVEGPGPDHDGDSDDAGAVVRATPAPSAQPGRVDTYA
ncbi:MAG: hypothetical protein ACRDNS_18660 [Trebonia sp.]